jgi:hypothetical protein
MKFLRSYALPERFAETVQKIENERFFDLDLFVRSF